MSNYSYESESIWTTIQNNKNIAIILSSILIAILGLVYFVPRILAPNTTTSDASSYNQLIRENDIVRGKKDSNITVVLFEDPQCPSCQSLSKTKSESLSKYYDKVKFVYKYVRAVQSHTFSKEAIGLIYATESVSQKGYELTEKIYKDTASLATLDRTTVLKYAEDLGVNKDQILTKSNEPNIQSLAAQQQKDFEFRFPIIEGYTDKESRISGTPGGFIIKDGKLVRVSSSQDRSSLVDKTKDFTTFDFDTYLEELTK
jgi:stress response protein YsnF